MNYLDLGWFVDRHLGKREGDHLLHVSEFTEELYNKLAPEQRRVIDRERLRKRVMELGLSRFGALRW